MKVRRPVANMQMHIPSLQIAHPCLLHATKQPYEGSHLAKHRAWSEGVDLKHSQASLWPLLGTEKAELAFGDASMNL